MTSPDSFRNVFINPCEGCNGDQCENCVRGVPVNEFSEHMTGDMPSMDSFYHFVQSRRRDGESFEQAEYRLRREV